MKGKTAKTIFMVIGIIVTIPIVFYAIIAFIMSIYAGIITGAAVIGAFLIMLLKISIPIVLIIIIIRLICKSKKK